MASLDIITVTCPKCKTFEYNILPKVHCGFCSKKCGVYFTRDGKYWMHYDEFTMLQDTDISFERKQSLTKIIKQRSGAE